MKIVENGIHNYSDDANFILDENSSVRAGTCKFRQHKLGFMTHFGIFNQLGIVESWALSDESDSGNWSQDKIDWTDINSFKHQYRTLNQSFNPVRLETDKIIAFLKNTGFEYAVIPTKHHDGFCMWGTEQTKYNVVDSTPYGKDVYEMFLKSCKKYGISFGAYFSKPDWYVNSYWNRETDNYGATRNPNYDTSENKELWNQFVEYTHKQVDEITSNGKVDILWLDGGWVSKDNNQDIDIAKVAEIARKYNPQTLVVDRTCGGKYENYITPEQTIPDTYLSVPWEANLSLGNSFAYEYDDVYKDEYYLSKTFIEVFSKGGNLLLNVALQPDGRLPKPAMLTLSKFSKWYLPLKKIITLGEALVPNATRKCNYWQYNEKYYVFKPSKPNSVFLNDELIDYDGAIVDIKLLVNGKTYDVGYKQIDGRVKVNIPVELIGSDAGLCPVYEIEVK